MKELTLGQLHLIMPKLPIRLADLYLRPLNEAMKRWAITTPQRQSAFLACLAYHSKQLRRWRDSGSGARDEFNEALGNFFPGDGKRFKAGGPFPIKGRRMYYQASYWLGIKPWWVKQSLIIHPERITEPHIGLSVAGWLWTQHFKCNAHADQQTEEGLWWCHWKLLGVGRWDRHKKLKGWKAVRDAWNRANKVLNDA